MEENRSEILKAVTQALMDLNDEFQIEQVIKDNKIIFDFNDVQYRLRKPTFIEQENLNKERTKKYLELINNPDFIFREQWIKKYKDKGIDIVDMEHQIRLKQTEIESLLLRLAKSSTPEDIDTLKNQILALRSEQADLTIKKGELLSYSIEDSLMVYINQYVSYLMLEKKDGENWFKAFENYEAFTNTDTKLINKAYYYMTRLIYETEL